eukprot:m.445066 g.445066  ORF g.445066 m.445066 type:complete len:98 (+) comp56843_c0_seq9:649-942(+)
MRAVEGGHLECFGALVEAGADVSDSNEDGQTLVHVAGKNGHVAMLGRLLSLPQLAAMLTNRTLFATALSVDFITFHICLNSRQHITCNALTRSDSSL